MGFQFIFFPLQQVDIQFLLETGCTSFQDVLDVFRETKGQLGEILSAFEFIDAASMEMIVENLQLTNPISPTPFYVLIETGGSNKDHDEEKLSALLGQLLDKGKAVDGTLATETSKIQVGTQVVRAPNFFLSFKVVLSPPFLTF